MAVHNRGTLNSDHRRHDRLLVTRFAAGDSYPSDEAEAKALVAGCSDCAELAADIRLLSMRAQELTAPRRPRDFRISAEQADRLRGNWFERLMRGLAAPGWGTALRPMAGAAMAIGLMLVVIGSLPLGAAAPASQPAGARSPLRDNAAATQAPAPAPTIESAPEQPGGQLGAEGPNLSPSERDMETTADDGTNDAGDPNLFSEVYVASPDPEGSFSGGGAQVSTQPPARGQLLLFAGVLTLAVGTALLLLVLFARRRFGDALIR